MLKEKYNSMPTYTYICNKCNNKFEEFYSLRDYIESPKCSGCGSCKTSRSYSDDIASISGCVKKHDSELRTIGDIANRNRDRMSEDQKQALSKKHNEYKDPQFDKPLPKGMTRLKKQSKIKWT